MAWREYLIETADFVGGQLTPENYPQVVKDLIPYLSTAPVAHFDGDGDITYLSHGDTGDVLISLGWHYSLEENSYGVYGTALQLLEAYEERHGVVPGEGVEEKLGNIVFASFQMHLTTISMDEHMELLDGPDWSATHFPWGMDKKSLLQRSVRGFSDVDWYNFNFYFARVLRDMALKFSRDGHRAPDPEWEAKMKTMAAGFQHFIEQDDFEDDYEYDPEITKEALAIFVEMFERLWD